MDIFDKTQKSTDSIKNATFVLCVSTGNKQNYATKEPSLFFVTFLWEGRPPTPRPCESRLIWRFQTQFLLNTAIPAIHCPSCEQEISMNTKSNVPVNINCLLVCDLVLIGQTKDFPDLRTLYLHTIRVT